LLKSGKAKIGFGSHSVQVFVSGTNFFGCSTAKKYHYKWLWFYFSGINKETYTKKSLPKSTLDGFWRIPESSRVLLAGSVRTLIKKRLLPRIFTSSLSKISEIRRNSFEQVPRAAAAPSLALGVLLLYECCFA
jgi:hypothetical protein